jgi:hypothetical protein
MSSTSFQYSKGVNGIDSTMRLAENADEPAKHGNGNAEDTP